MKQISWLTDIHLNFLEEPKCSLFLDEIAHGRFDGVIIAGDIAEGHTVTTYLARLAKRLACPIYFVLGNHDYYFNSFDDVHDAVRELCRSHPNLHWLSESGIIPLTGQTAMMGHDGWADGQFGSFFDSDVEMTDYFLIEDLARLDPQTRFAKLNALAERTVSYFDKLLPEALRQYERVILVTHVPPFREACLYNGEISDDNYLPHFACRALGESLLQIMSEFPDRHATLLCGHTHARAEVQVAPNLLVKTGGAEYGAPVLQEVLTL